MLYVVTHLLYGIPIYISTDSLSGPLTSEWVVMNNACVFHNNDIHNNEIHNNEIHNNEM